MLEQQQQVRLDGTWAFSPGFLSCDQDSNYISNQKEEWWDIEVPYCWNGSKWMTVLGDYYTQNGYYKDHEVPPFPDHQGIGWYKKTFRLDALKNSRRIHIYFAGVSAKAILWVNGREVGSHLGAYSGFGWDITDYIQWYQQEQTILVKVWDKSCFYPSDDPAYLIHKINTKVPGRATTIPVGETKNNGGIDRPVYLYGTHNTYIKDMDIETTEDKLEARVHLKRHQVFGKTYKVKAVLRDASGDMVYEEEKITKLPEEDMSLLFRGDRLPVKAWWPHDPVCYSIEVTLYEDGEVIGSTQKTIGFKTFTCGEGRFYLNGQPYFLRGAGSPPHTVILHDEAYIDKFMAYSRELNINCIRFHTEPPSRYWLDACDRYGMLVIYEMPLMQQAPDPTHTRREFKEMVAQAKHHPSMAIYCLSNELDHFSQITDPIGYEETYIYLNDLHEAVREADPSLPVYNNAGFRDKRTCGDIKDVHSYQGWYNKATINLEKCLRYNMDDKGTVAEHYFGSWEKRVQEDSHKPLIITEFIGAYTDDDGRFYQVPAARRFIGADPDPNNERALWYQAHLIEESVEIFRRERTEENGLAGFAPFALFNWFFHPLRTDKISPKPAARILEKILEPLHVSLRWERKRIFQGESLEVDVYLIHDDVRYEQLEDTRIEYTIYHGDKSIGEGSIPSGTIPYYSNKIQRLMVDTDPCGKNPGTYTLEVSWVNNQGQCLSTNRLDFQIFQKTVEQPSEEIVQVYDPLGKTLPLLQEIGLRTKPVEDFSGLIGTGHILIGCDCLMNIQERDIAYLQQAIRRGSNVLVLEQNLYGLGVDEMGISWIDETPLRIVKEGRGIDDYVYVQDDTHCVFKGLEKEDFREWSKDRIIISSYLQQGDASRQIPAKTKFGSRFGYKIKKYDHVTSLIACSNFLKDDGLIQVPMGEGRVLLSQLEACRRYGEDPVATLYLDNLMTFFTDSHRR